MEKIAKEMKSKFSLRSSSLPFSMNAYHTDLPFQYSYAYTNRIRLI